MEEIGVRVHSLGPTLSRMKIQSSRPGSLHGTMSSKRKAAVVYQIRHNRLLYLLGGKQ